jgi:hypothetical protein
MNDLLPKTKVVLEGNFIRDPMGWTSYHRTGGEFIEHWFSERLSNAAKNGTTKIRITVETFEELE